MSIFNDALNLETSIDSLLCQTYSDFEFIIIDDGSFDGSGECLDRISEKDSRVRVIHQDNMGLTRALIRGCDMVRGEFICRQDSGDSSFSTRLEK